MVVEKKGNVFLGIIGAVIGMIVGLIPIVLVTSLTNSVFSLVFALTPICIAFGYYLLGKSGGSGAIAITIILSLVAVVIGDFLVLYVVALNKADLPLSLALRFYIDLLFRGDKDILKSLGQMFIFMILGLVVARRFIAGFLLRSSSSKTTENVYQGQAPLQQSGNFEQYQQYGQHGEQQYNPEQTMYPNEAQFQEVQIYETESQPQYYDQNPSSAPAVTEQIQTPENTIMAPAPVTYVAPDIIIDEVETVESEHTAIDVDTVPTDDGFKDTPFK